MACFREILCSIPSIGPVATAVILAFLPEIGKLDGKQAASRAGLAHYSRGSGHLLERQVLHQRGPQAVARRTLHAFRCRNALQP
nr:IS110 family transposase [Mangrovicoccus sp. HB161399]